MPRCQWTYVSTPSPPQPPSTSLHPDCPQYHHQHHQHHQQHEHHYYYPRCQHQHNYHQHRHQHHPRHYHHYHHYNHHYHHHTIISIVLYPVALMCLASLLGTTLSSTTSSPAVALATMVPSTLDQSLATKMLPPEDRKHLEDDLLRMLHLEQKPRVRRKALIQSAPNYLFDLYTTLQDPITGMPKQHPETKRISKQSLEYLEESDLVVSFSNHIQSQRRNPTLRQHRERRFWFNVSHIPDDAYLFDAQLQVFRDLKLSKVNTSHDLELTLFALEPTATGGGGEDSKVVKHFVDRLHIDGDVEGWLSFNVTVPVDQWVEHPENNLGLYLQIRHGSYPKDLSPKTVGLVTYRGNKEYQPFLTAFLEQSDESAQEEADVWRRHRYSVNRLRRAANKKRSDIAYYDQDNNNPYLKFPENTQSYSSGRSCQKLSLYVSFRDLNWQDWIIAPEGYSAYHCSGQCMFPMSSHMNATNHAIVQHLMHIMTPNTVPKPCCAPRELTSIMVLFIDEQHNVILKKFKNMVVESCGCR